MGMTRFRICRVLVLAGGLLWLGCEIPVSPLPNVGDEIRLTNDPGPNRDPFWYTWGDPETLEGSQICYHDGRTIYLYDWDSGAIVELYTAPEGYEITTLDLITPWYRDWGFAFALHGEGQTVVIAIIDDKFEVELLRDQGPPIESMSVDYDPEDDSPWGWGKHYALVLSRNEDLYVFYTNGTDDRPSYGIYLTDGYDIYTYWYEVYFVREKDEGTSICRLDLWGYEGIDIYGIFSDGYTNRYPTPCLCVSDKGSTWDIWDYQSGRRLTDDAGEERELDVMKSYLNDNYVVFNRVTDGRSDLYVARW
jgi:hypothetical protein